MKALVVVDVQNDFCPGGALGVREGDRVVPFINRIMKDFDLVVATKDWHPADHGSFASNHPGSSPGEIIDLDGLDQILWPDHCVQGSEGAEFHSDLDTSWIHKIFYKGTDPEVDSYSAIFDNDRRKSTGLDAWLLQQGVTEVWIAGLATDYCVKYTALDAVDLDFEIHVLLEGCRGVELNPGDVEAAVEEMRSAGVVVEDRGQGAEDRGQE